MKLDNNNHSVFLMSRSFCLLTTGYAPVEVIKKYIESQGEVR